MARPRLRLIVNPVASGVRERSVRVALNALEPHCDVELVETERRDHASELAAEAVARGFDGVAAMGGDGTANEVLNGTGDALPVGVLPAGGTSVLPRALGMPRNIGAAAASLVADALVEGRERRINLGVVNGRRFAFAAGVGADAQAVRLVDGAGRAKGRRPGDAYFAAQIMRTLLRGDFREPQLEVSMDDEVVARGVSVFAANVHPWSYLGPFALKLAPRATFEGGLDVVVPSDMRRRHLPRYATQLLVTGSQARRTDKLLAYLHDVDGVRVSCSRPLPMHADGDDLGDVEEAVFGVARNAARILVTTLLFDLDGTLVDSRAVVERQWRRLCERLGLDFAEVLAVLHGVRSADVIRAFAPDADVEAEAAALDAAEQADTEGWRSCRARPRCWPDCRRAAGASSPRATARSRRGASAPSACRCPDVMVCGDEVARRASPIPRATWPPRGCSARSPRSLRRLRGRPGRHPGGARRGHARDRHHDHAPGLRARRRERS